MNQKIINYLKANKGKYSLDILKKELIKSGYKEHDIGEAAGFVYRKSVSDSNRSEKRLAHRFNIFTKKDYSTSAEKVIDFIIGLLLPWVIGVALYTIDDDFLKDFLWLPLSIFIALMFITYRPRRYIFKGLYFNFSVIGMLVVAAILYFVIFEPRFF